MASNEELKIAVIATARTEALTRARKELNKLGGDAAVKAQRELNKLNRAMKILNPTAKKSAGLFSKFTQKVALGNLAAIAATKALNLMKNAIKGISDTIVLAGEVEELGIVYEFVGQKAGFSARELEFFREQLIQNGIAQKESTQALLRGLQAEIAFTDVVKLSKIARDAAVIGQTNTSDALVRITNSLAKLLPRELKELGIIINLNQVYKEFSATLGKNATDLTEAEKKTAFLNEILEKGENIAGAYGVAMESASKQLRSLERFVQDARVEVGQEFTPILMLAVKAQELFFKVTAKIGQLLQREDIFSTTGIQNIINKMQEWIDKSISLAKVIFGFSKFTVNFFSAIKNAIEIVIEPLTDFSIAMGKLITLDFAGASVSFTSATIAMQKQIQDLVIDLVDMSIGADMVEQGLAELNIETGKNTEAVHQQIFAYDSLFNTLDLGGAKFFDFKTKLFETSPLFGQLDIKMQKFGDDTIQGFRQMQNAAQSFLNTLQGGELTFGSFLNLAFQLVSLFGSGGLFGAGGFLGVAAPAVGGTSPALAGASGVNIQGNITVVTNATSPQAVAREIENLGSRNLTTIQTEPQRITR